jgi:hypothetical protein
VPESFEVAESIRALCLTGRLCLPLSYRATNTKSKRRKEREGVSRLGSEERERREGVSRLGREERRGGESTLRGVE